MTDTFPPLGPGERVLSPGESLLYRQITTHNWDDVNGWPASTAFGPATIDAGMASFALDGPGVDAQTSRDWHQDNAKSPSLGVWAVTTLEVVDACLRSVDDTDAPLAAGQKRAPGHAYVDFRGLTKGAVRSARKALLLRAKERGEFETTDKLAP